MIRVLVFLLLAATLSQAEIIPAARRIDWFGNVGVPGGIPARTMIFQTLSAGATVAQINTAIANCPSGQVVKLNAGTYNLGATKVNFASKNGVTLRGAGMGQTIINASGGFTTDQYGWTAARNLSSGYTKGSTSIVTSTTPGASYQVGRMICISSLDDTSFVFTSGGSGRHIQFQHRITGVAGNTITFEPPLPWTLSAGLTPQVIVMDSVGVTLCGIEDMTVNYSGSGNIVELWDADRCWVKNVDMVGMADSGIWILDSLQCEVRHCTFRDAQGEPNNSDGYGVLLYGVTVSSSWHLIEDNIAYDLFVGFWTKQASANAFLYNFCANSEGQSFDHQRGIMNAGHGAHPMMTLWEGNVGEQWQHDGYHGSASHQTLFRNWLHGLNSRYNDNRKMIDLTRGSYFYNVVGNVLGDASWSGPGTFQYEMTGQPGYNGASVIYRLGYPNMANNSLSDGNPWPGSGLTYPDAQTKNTLIRHGNFDHFGDVIVWDATIADHSIPNSLYYSSKPTYFGNLAWPAYDPANPSNASVDDIPAGYRFTNGTDPPTSTDTTAPTPNPMTFSSNPAAVDSVSITMTASLATDETSAVEYFFDQTSANAGGTDSGWQSSRTYVDAGLSPSTQYTYRVKARDASLNETSYSSAVNATTQAPPPGTIDIQTLGVTNLRVSSSQAAAPGPLLQGGRFGFTLPNFTGASGAMTAAQFANTFAGGMHVPDTYRGWITAGRDIRLLNPSGVYMKHINLRTLYGEDTSHPDDDYIHANHPEWVVRDSAGNPVPIFVAGEESLDFGNNAYLDWVLNTWVPNEYVDSTDDDPNLLTFYMHDNGNFKAQTITCGASNPICDTYTSDAGMQTAWKNMLDRWAARWPNKKLIVSGGANTFEAPATQLVYMKDVLAHAAGFYTESLTDRHSYFVGSPGSSKRNNLLTTLQLADWLADNDKYFIGSMSPENSVTISQDDVNYAFAFFNLLRRGNKQLYGHITKDGSDLWQPATYPEMDLPLGNPLENRTEISTNVYRRSFENAISYVNISDSTANITLPAGTFENSLGATVGSPLSLPSFTGLTIYRQ